MIKAGDTITTASRNGSRTWHRKGLWGPLWCIGTYVAKPRQSDGVLTWRLDSREGSYSVKTTAEREAEAHAQIEGSSFLTDIRLGLRCNPTPPPPPEPVEQDIHDWAYGEAA
ncbi:hypothetical protein N9917_03495 [Deltaproteobacteria bacterium]|nr:hypothetical protein [Deltaproteobacteria bacterium]